MADKIYYNSGALFEVKNKKSAKAPDYRTQITIDAETLKAIVATNGKISIAAWSREGASGDFISLLVSADTYVKEAPIAATQRAENKSNKQEDEFENDIPF